MTRRWKTAISDPGYAFPIRSGNEFRGWSTDRYAAEPEYTYYASGDTDDRYRMSDQYATLYAVWEAAQQTYRLMKV